MVTARRARSSTRGTARGGVADNTHVQRQDDRNNLSARVQLSYRDISELRGYAYNPRDNEPAIESVANSIKTFGFLVPVVVDASNVIIAGHTRVAAAQSLGLSEVPVVQVEHLSEEEANAFRLIDNKTAELSLWSFDLLAGEISKLQGSGLILTDFGWTQESLDCLTDVVASDCLNTDGLVDLDAQERLRRLERRAPITARFVLGEVVFFIPATDYRRWVDSLRTQYDYNEAEIIAAVKQRLGITEEAVVATARVERGPRAARA
ncbi:MAG: ParB N-terminal domain-containing protein [Sulfuricella sp.]|nr:ParB N-terminal domain-containing protein [Sulfuricella sp.]